MILLTQVLGPFIHLSICGYMHTYYMYCLPLCSPCVLGMCTACAIRERPDGVIAPALWQTEMLQWRHSRLIPVLACAALLRDEGIFHGSTPNFRTRPGTFQVQSHVRLFEESRSQPSLGPCETAIFEEELTRRWAEDNRLLACVPHWSRILNLSIYISYSTCMHYYPHIRSLDIDNGSKFWQG